MVHILPIKMGVFLQDDTTCSLCGLCHLPTLPAAFPIDSQTMVRYRPCYPLAVKLVLNINGFLISLSIYFLTTLPVTGHLTLFCL